ncbi:MAG TPA: D-2-hydroxyacid dehydrogenase [Opitutaceae bacterium]|jgi:phosphoglycerate dehydrogenase-like enzyme|nr:D-2-hydroxyacid dehydrogenase [Opitutaceae bacterium]
MSLTIWCNAKFSDAAEQQLREGTRGHRLIFPSGTSANVLEAGKLDPMLAEADVAFGQPDAEECMRLPRLKWIEVTSAGYTRYDREDFRMAWRTRGGAFTNASSVFSEPCAQHALAFMLALGRSIFPSYRDQLTDHSWHYTERRATSQLLTGQTVLMLGFGAIGRRLAELLAPFRMQVYAVRRQTRSEPGVRIIPEEELTRVLPLADHVVNILPENETTRGYVNARRLGWFKPGAKFYNIGRGTTVDQRALLEALQGGRLGAACLDVMDPEPLPPEHPLWTAPNCFITSHTAGGRNDQDEALVRHFLANFETFVHGGVLTDRVI